MFNNNKLKDVASAVSKVMEASVKEELKGNQHKIDANKNNKVDAHDFKLLRAGKKVAKEETEQVEEGIEDKLEAARAKAKAAGKTIKSPAKAEKSNVTKVAGKAYGGAAQKDEPEADEDDTPKKASKKGVFKRRYNTKMYKEEFSGLLDSYVNGGLKSIMEDLEVVEEETTAEVINEEVDNETFTKEVEAQKAKAEGKGKKADVAAASVQAVTKEEAEQIEELSSKTLDSYATKAALSNFAKRAGMAKAQDKHDNSLIAKHLKPRPKFSDKEEKKMERRAKFVGKAVNKLSSGVKEEVESVEERTLTEPEMKKREEVVKSMKKNLAGFKERYGSRAKEVMYATATKTAKGEK